MHVGPIHTYTHMHICKCTHKHKNVCAHRHSCTCTARTDIDPLVAIPNRVACSSYYHHFHHNNYQHQQHNNYQHHNGRFGCVVGQNPHHTFYLGVYERGSNNTFDCSRISQLLLLLLLIRQRRRRLPQQVGMTVSCCRSLLYICII